MGEQAMLTRRWFGATGAAALVSSCATARGLREGVMTDLGRRPRERLQLPPALVSRQRVIRVDVGLRPYRPSGFRAEREQRDAKAIVHNYGHGGGGITLSWGSAHLAVELGFDPAIGEYAVIGCGALGLATARLLQERGARVRIYAKALPPNVTSNVAGAQWWPASVFDRGVASEAFVDQLVAAMAFSFRRFQSMAGEHYGVDWETNYFLQDGPIRNYPARDGGRLEQFVVNQRDLSPAEHPFPFPHVRAFDTMMIETPNYLRAVLSDFHLAGGEIVVREFAGADELQTLPEMILFNCTGLGAGALFGDAEIEPVRGQLVILEPQAEVRYNVIADGLYMFGRRDGIVLGGTFEHGEWSLTPSEQEIARILNGHAAIFGAMAAA